MRVGADFGRADGAGDTELGITGAVWSAPDQGLVMESGLVALVEVTTL
ncbi:MAG: hypothetical protein JWQ77_2586 [Jatrophihabitans sp.]|nr:hypothetical protein [Jatrophihabitans sp.]